MPSENFMKYEKWTSSFKVTVWFDCHSGKWKAVTVDWSEIAARQEHVVKLTVNKMFVVEQNLNQNRQRESCYEMAKHAIILASLEILKSQDKDALKVTKGMWEKKSFVSAGVEYLDLLNNYILLGVSQSLMRDL